MNTNCYQDCHTSGIGIIAPKTALACQESIHSGKPLLVATTLQSHSAASWTCANTNCSQVPMALTCMPFPIKCRISAKLRPSTTFLGKWPTPVSAFHSHPIAMKYWRGCTAYPLLATCAPMSTKIDPRRSVGKGCKALVETCSEGRNVSQGALIKNLD